jgi:RNA polymerase sigma-70 factor (ECF subfamily)
MEPLLKLVENTSAMSQAGVDISTTNSADVNAKTLELELIKAAQAYDKVAFRRLYDMHMPRVYALCCRLCADRSQAEDATQEVFIQVWRKIQNFKGESQFSTWLHSVAANVTVSYIRKQRGWWQRMMNIEDSSADQQEAETSIADIDFEKLIYRLPERARMVFVLHAIEGYRHEQVADTLDMAVGTSKAQFHRARKLIEEWIDE